MKNKEDKAKILILDIETAPILANVWDIWDQNISLEQIEQDWFIIAFAAKWLDDPANKTIYYDQRRIKNIENDKQLLDKVWKLLDSCDILITQNGKKFDAKKLNARFILNGMQPPSSYRHIDTLRIAKKHFAFTSNKLAYLTSKLNVKYKKLDHKKFPGFQLWKECLKGNIVAWKEMEKYNKHDVLSLEETYKKLIPWDNSIDFNVYHNTDIIVCSCGSEDFSLNGYAYTPSGKYQRYRCKKCGAEGAGRKNLLTKIKKASLLKRINRSQ